MNIRICNENDILEVGRFYDKVVLHLCQTTNYPKWEYKVYPSELSVREKVSLEQQFVCMDEENIVGAFVLNDDPQGKYGNANWSVEVVDGEYMVCHTLAADPDLQGKGIGKQMVSFHSQMKLLYEEEYQWLWENKHICHYHVNDYADGYKEWEKLRTLPIGQGHIDFDRFFEFIQKIGYHGTFTVEATAFDSNGVIDIQMLNQQFEFIRNAMD